MPTKVSRIILKWTAGFGASLVSIWGITAIFTVNFIPETWIPELERNVPAPGWTYDYRGESWARTRFGEFGLAGVQNIREESSPKIFIWGDSFIRAVHVDDHHKTHAQLARSLRKDGGLALEAISIGQDWWSLPDYFFRIPDYEGAIDGCVLHVVHLFTLEDTLPDRYPGARTSLFLSKPEYRFEKFDNEYQELEKPITNHPLRDFAYRSRLQFFLKLRTRSLKLARLEGLRFRPGIQLKASAGEEKDTLNWDELKRPDWVTGESPVEAWRFGLQSLKQITDRPILFVYAPVTPCLENGKVLEENPEAEMAATFAEFCDSIGIGFVSLETSFLEFWRRTGKLPRGFPTSRPGEGHYNEDGHRLVAEAIHTWIRENDHVVHPD